MVTSLEEKKEDVLYAFSVEDHKDIDILSSYIIAYPQYRDELIDLSVSLLLA